MKNYLLLFAFICSVITSHSQNEYLDSSFGNQGKAIIDISGEHENCADLVLQDNGKFLITGSANLNGKPSIMVLRCHPDGSLDESFGTNGSTIVPIDTFSSSGNGISLQDDGKILVCGDAQGYTTTSVSRLILLRFTPNGQLDASFGNNGIVSTEIGYRTRGVDILPQADGKILVGGEVHILGTSTFFDFILLRYLENGHLDSSFADAGKRIIDFTDEIDGFYQMGVQSDGKIIMGGYSQNSAAGNYQNFSLARFFPDGRLDTSFGNNGKVITDFNGSGDIATALKILPNDKILLSGYTNNNGNEDYVVVRYNTNGSLDPFFGVGGIAMVDLGLNSDRSATIDIQDDGKIIVGGWSSQGFEFANFSLIRLHTNGRLDENFGNAGIITTPFNVEDDLGRALVIQPDGKILFAGTTDSGEFWDIAIARYLPELSVGLLDPPNVFRQSLVYPNPIDQQATLEYELNESQSLSIRLYDTAGQLLQSFAEQEIRQRGKHREILHFQDGLPKGSYVLQILSEQGQVSIQLIK